MHSETRTIKSVSELPDPRKIGELFADAETISKDKKRGGNKPYLGDRAVGWGICVDDNPTGFYVPLRHNEIGNNVFSKQHANIDIGQFRRWMNDAMKHCNSWVNHNIKFDGHLCEVDGIESADRMVDTLTLAKVVDGQRRGQDYALKKITGTWMGENTEARDAVDDELKRMKTRDFGQIDSGILGPYAVDDVHRNRRLWHEINRRRYEGDERVWEMEIKVTRALFNIERRPMQVDQERLSDYRTRYSIIVDQCEDKIEKLGYNSEALTGARLKSFVFDDLKLPKVAFTDRGQPSINADAIDVYLLHEDVRDDATLRSFFQTLSVYRKHSQFISLYANGWEKWMDSNGIMHPMYNQTVSTGRMSSTSPNFQQLDSDAKSCIIPGAGMAFISRDYSQIEYRVIASICGDERMIAAYRDNPDTDFHQFVADLCGIARRPAKSVNFGIAFTMGLHGLIRQLRASLGDVSEEQAQEVLTGYNKEFPRVQGVSKAVVNVARSRARFEDGAWGFIKTLYGRRRYLQFRKYRNNKDERAKFTDDTRLAFNSTVQGTAADIMKEALVKMDESEIMRSSGVHVAGAIHDDFVGRGSKDATRDPEVIQEYEAIMCSPSVNLGLPLIASGGRSELNLKEAG